MARRSKSDPHAAIASRLHGNIKFVAFMDRLEKSNIHRAAVEPFRTEVFHSGPRMPETRWKIWGSAPFFQCIDISERRGAMTAEIEAAIWEA
jgi:hypothetical protein